MTDIATGAQHTVSYVEETTYGTTPSSPVWTPIPNGGCTIGVNRDPIVANKIRGDRQQTGQRPGNKNVGGDVTSELEYGSFDDLLEAVFMGTWTSDVLKTGLVERSFTIQRKFADIATPEFHRATGMIVNTLALKIAPNAMVSAVFGFIGQDFDPATAEVASASYNSISTNQAFDSFNAVISEGGSTSGVVTSLDINIDNGHAARFVVGSDTTIEMPPADAKVSGSLSVYYETKALYEKAINGTSSSISVVLTDPDGNDLEFEMNNVQYSGFVPEVSDTGSVSATGTYSAYLYAADGSNIVATRTAA